MGFEHLKNAVSFSKSTRIWPFIYLGLIGLGAWLWEWKEWTLLALAVPGAIGLSLALVKSRTRFFGLWLFRVSFTASLLWGGWSFCSSPLGPSSNYDFQKEAPLISAIQEKIGSNRVFLGDHIPFPVETGGNIIPIDSPANISEVFHIKNAGGCNALSLLARGELYTTPFPTFLRLMDIQGFATGNEKGEVPDFQRFQWSGVKFYKSREEKSAVYAPTSWKVMENPVLRLEAMRRTNFNPYETTILSQPFSSTEPIENKGGKNKLSFKITKDGLNEQDFEIQIQKSGLVVFSEANYPGWRAWVDGQTTPIVTANHLFRGLNIPAGHHQVLFRFEPLIIRVSFFSILLWMLSAGLYWGVRGIQKISV
jgi:hypothetical protein